MKNKTQFNSKNITISVVCFFLSLIMVLFTILVLADVTIFNDRDVSSKVSGTTFFSQLSKDVSIRCKTVCAKCGVDYGYIENVITPNRIENDMDIYFNSISAKDPTAGRKSLDEKSLAKEIYNSILSKDSNLTKEQKSNAEIISLKIANEYKDTIALDNYEEFMSFSNGWQSGSLYIFIILFVLVIYLIAVIICLNGKRTKHRLYRHFAVVGGSSGFTVLVFALVIKFSGVFEKMSFYDSEREYNLFMSYFNELIDSAVTLSMSFIIICMVLLVLWYLSVSGRIKR